MSINNSPTLELDPWHSLTRYTQARIALGRYGISLPTRAYLQFQLDHALARDAVITPLNCTKLAQRLNMHGYESLTLQSQAENKAMYLQRPDLGRLLNSKSVNCLQLDTPVAADAVIVIADGLSSNAIEHHAEPFLNLLLPELQEKNYILSPVCLVKHGRVAIGDIIAEYYRARLCVVLIGERPGLSSPDSMGIYFTYKARAGLTTDADRNCISNIHNNGLTYHQALKKLLFLIDKSEKLMLSGVTLKDETTDFSIDMGQQVNFLLD